jgi:dipeptidyl-peptidase-4
MHTSTGLRGAALCVAAIAVAFAVRPDAQDRLPGMPGYEQYTRMAPRIANSIVSGAAANVRWAADSQSVRYTIAGRGYLFDLASLKAEPENQPAGALGRGAGPGTGRRGAPPTARGGLEQAQAEMVNGPTVGCPTDAVARGRQENCVVSPDGRQKAFFRTRNVWIAAFDGSNERPVTRDLSEFPRIKYGVASWVYGEELGQTTAIWWSPDSRRLAFYRFDEGEVRDFYVQMNQTAIQDTMDIEAYPKAGAANPVADVLVYDIATSRTTTIDVRDGRPFDDEVMGHYVFGVEWSPGADELVMQRSNRRQQVIELIACDPASGRCRVLLREAWSTGWLNAGIDPRATPVLAPRWLADGRRFIWESERNGWRNYYLYERSGRLLNAITTHTSFETNEILKVDEANGLMFYTARDGDNYLKLQVHRVGLDGRGDVRLTDSAYTHTVPCAAGALPLGGLDRQTAPADACAIAPDNHYFVDVYQTHDRAPSTALVDASTGRIVAELGRSDLTAYDAAGFRRAEQFTYLAADGRTRLIGQISFPSDFDPAKRYPVLVSVYGGPILQGQIPTETFSAPSATAEYGFLTVLLGYRGVPGLGKHAADAMYRHLGVSEVDDMAAGIRTVAERPYVDAKRIGIYGTSYGGYVAAAMLLRYPELVSAASSSSPVTAWEHYDSIYTERYMGLPDENRTGYEAGSLMTYAGRLRGRLLLYYGTADNNVHQNNSVQLVQALQRAGKSFELQIGPDRPHSSVNTQRMMEFFIENLVMRPERLIAPSAQ